MAERNVELVPEWSERGLDTAEDTLVAMETLLATLRAFEDGLRQQELSVESSADYCDNFCQALMHYAGSRNSIDHGLPLLEVYCLSINCFAAARSHLTAESDRVTLVLKRLALSCFELFLSVPENEIPYEAWVQFHQSVQIAHDTLLQYGSTDLQALLQITGEGGAWSNPVLSALLSGQPTSPQDVEAYISLEGEGFMEMRVKHLEKMGEVAKAVVLAKACTECSAITNQATFRHTYVSLLCQLLPTEEAIIEISRQDCKDVLEITSNLETEGEENTGFILCTTFLTQQLQQPSLDHSWDLILMWSKLQRRLDSSLVSLLERCLQLGAIAKTVQHLLYLVRVIQTEAEAVGIAASVELCVKALQLPKHDDSESRISICNMVSGLLLSDLEVQRACLLTEFLLGPSQQVLSRLEELYQRPDQKYDQESGIIPNSLRCELLLVLKAHWSIDPEFWDWKTLKYHCSSILGLKPESEGEGDQEQSGKPLVLQVNTLTEEPEHKSCLNGSLYLLKEPDCDKMPIHVVQGEVRRAKLCCRICKRSFTDAQLIHHSKRHVMDDQHPCPICLQNFRNRKELLPHMRHHIQSETHHHSNNVKIGEDEIEPGEISIDPSLVLYYESTHDPEVLQHIVQHAKTVKDKCTDNEHVTFDYINRHFSLRNREEYFCPGTGCSRVFKHSKYLYVHLKSDHKGDENVKHFHQMREQREKCAFCRRHFVSAYHHHKHRKIHYCEQPYLCVVMGCGAQFGSSNELVLHKQIHGYQLNYQCELEGCYVNYSDLGQLYHHEAQHFRDAAFTCPGPICKKFYFSKREFIEHLSTHSITFSEKDFEVQRNAKETIFKADMERAALVNNQGDADGSVNGECQKTSSESCATSCQPSVASKPKAVLTLVAMCFDGSKFTCGFEKCGMTFSRARDVQRHLKHAHPEHLKLENKDHKPDKERGPKCKKVKAEMESDNEEDENQLSAPCSPGEDLHECATPPLTAVLDKNDVLKEILIGLSKLDLNSLSPQSVQNNTPHSTQEENASLHRAVIEKQPVVVLSKASSQLPKGNATEEKASGSHQVNFKPYSCEMGKCSFRSAQSNSLLRHYVTMHGHTREQAKRMSCFKDSSFKPFKCHLCFKSLREKRGLRSHYLRTHKLSFTLVDKFVVRSTRGTKPTLQKLNPTVKIEVPSWDHEMKKKSDNIQTPRSCSSSLDQNGTDLKEEESDHKEDGEDELIPQVRTRRLVAKSNLCYILDKFNKPFHCVAKNCDAAFSTQVGLVRHLQLVHHYKRSQLLLEQEVQHIAEVKKENVKKSPSPNSDEPKPQFRCQFVNCNASYHLKSSLARHTRIVHSQTPELIWCKYDGCAEVFTHTSALKKHTLYRHCQYYDSLVVRLQSTHKKSVTGCQKKLIVTPADPVTPVSTGTPVPESKEPDQPEEAVEAVTTVEKESKRKRRFSAYVFRSHEEALQMCQDRCFRVAYPCMIQDCDSVLKYIHNLTRHYKAVHQMQSMYLKENAAKLFFTAERLEELIQWKSARPTVVAEENPRGAGKMECPPEPETSQEQPAQVNLHSVEAETQGEEVLKDPLSFSVEEVLPPVERNGVLVGADDVLYGEPSTGAHAEDSVVTMPNGHKQVEKILNLEQIKPLLRPFTINLSPPCSVHFPTEEGIQDAAKDDGKTAEKSASSSLPVRQPLKRKNEISAQASNVIDPQPLGSPPHAFDITTYKPVGFEASFLKFIQDNSPKDKNMPVAKRRETSRRSCSVKENKQVGISFTRSRRSHPMLHKSRGTTGDFPSVRNLKSILDKALAGCGDMAIKQLQHLRPVVVLGKPICTATLPQVFPSGPTNSKLLPGSKV
ncbi:zinc finger protein Rlf [Syngnathoides biaculeatus]|uniref:zinc finger protein Rlf n=1 Tax=Syngnathoides biaculeatus TaxID=300417 RepID=UPI002ADD55A5|nr:zinc finger protein Rlf [Syngnathoides biaculeatus]